jgi:hypothetical protein
MSVQEEELSSAAAIMDQEFLRQVAALRNSLEGQTVVNLGSTWTAEAREPDRKRRLHLQLTLARQLRARLEDAADQAAVAATQMERMDILEQRTEDVNTLVSLTQAVKRGYTLDHYDEYSRYLRKEPVKSDENKDRDVIVKQLVAMKEERLNPEDLTASAASSPLPAVSSSGLPSKKRGRKPKASAPKASAAAKARGYPSDSESSSKKPAGRASKPADMDQELYEYHSSDDEEYTPDLSMTSSSKHRSNSAKRKKRRSVASRRCHDCKSSTTYFRRCHYWFLTGTKCAKTFCSKCLVFKYGLPSEGNWNMNDPDWQ